MESSLSVEGFWGSQGFSLEALHCAHSVPSLCCDSSWMLNIDPEKLAKWPGPCARDVADFDPGKPLFADAECELLSLGRWKCLESWLALKNLFPVAQEKYMCKFGAAPATEAVRISLTEVSQAHAFAFALLS